MIRRPAGSQRWILIAQGEHARVAGELAAVWQRDPPLGDVAARELLAAVYHHDDGWTDWDRAPAVDPERGVPLAFTEMPLGESLAIWRQSIRAATAYGHLAAYIVAGHFSALLERFGSWRRGPESQRAMAEQFLEEQRAFMADRQAAWQQAHPGLPADAILGRALAWLQFFDSLSLWLCTAERKEGETMNVPAGPAVTLIPVAPAAIAIDPWPLAGGEKTVEVAGRSVEAAHYRDREHLAAAEGEMVWLPFAFSPLAAKVKD